MLDIAFLVIAAIAYKPKRLEGEYRIVSTNTSAAFEIEGVTFP